MRRHQPWWRRLRRRALRISGRAKEPAGWILLVGAAATFVGVLVGLIATGGAKVATLLIAADLLVSGVDATPDEEDD